MKIIKFFSAFIIGFLGLISNVPVFRFLSGIILVLIVNSFAVSKEEIVFQDLQEAEAMYEQLGNFIKKLREEETYFNDSH